MKINKQFILEVAEGLHPQYDSRHGEIRYVAERIINEKLLSKFTLFCLRHYRSLDIHPSDVFDLFVDFQTFGSEIRIAVPREVHPTGTWQVFAMTPTEAMEKLWRDANENDALFEAALKNGFKMRGEKGAFHFNPCVLHHCLDNGSISEREMLELCRVA